MDISVVVPTYNRAGLLPATLDAILAQTVSPAEIIVVDDGSQDETAAVLARFAPRVRAIRIENSGDLAARNAGLHEAAGELVAFCDSDDLWRPAFLARMGALWQAEPALTAAYSDFAIVRDGAWGKIRKFDGAPSGFWDGLRMVDADLGIFDESIVERLIDYQPFFTSCMVAHRRSFLSLGGWDEGVSRSVGCDFATALRMAECPPIGVVRQPLVGIRKHVDNFSADVQAMNLGDARVLEYVLATRPTLARYALEIRASIAKRRRDACHTAFAQGDFAGLKTIYDLLPARDRPAKLRFKRMVAELPPMLRRPIHGSLIFAGTVGSRLAQHTAGSNSASR